MLAFVMVFLAVVIPLPSTKLLEPRQFGVLEVYTTRARLHSIYFTKLSACFRRLLTDGWSWKRNSIIGDGSTSERFWFARRVIALLNGSTIWVDCSAYSSAWYSIARLKALPIGITIKPKAPINASNKGMVAGSARLVYICWVSTAQRS